MKGSGDKGFPVLDSGTSGLHVCSPEISIYCMRESCRFVSNSQSKKFKLIQKIFTEPFVSSAKVPPSKRRDKGCCGECLFLVYNPIGAN